MSVTCFKVTQYHLVWEGILIFIDKTIRNVLVPNVFGFSNIFCLCFSSWPLTLADRLVIQRHFA